MNRYTVTIGRRTFEVSLISRSATSLCLEIDGERHQVDVHPILTSSAREQHSGLKQAGGELRAPMPGIVSKIFKNAGDAVEAGETILTIEAMKMENPIKSPNSGIITALEVRTGSEVAHGALLGIIE